MRKNGFLLLLYRWFYMLFCKHSEEDKVLQKTLTFACNICMKTDTSSSSHIKSFKNHLEDCRGRYHIFIASALPFIKLESYPAVSDEKLSLGKYFFQGEQSFLKTTFLVSIQYRRTRNQKGVSPLGFPFRNGSVNE